jgi:hypothetical protein
VSDIERNLWSYVELKTTDIVIEEGIPFERWEELGDRLNAFIETGRWGLGRWIAYGEEHFGDDCRNAVAPSRSRRIDQALWVHRRCPPEIRHERLTWSHHRSVCGLDDHEMQRKLLDMAEQGDWDVSTLAKAVRQAKKAGKIEPTGTPAEVTTANRLFGPSGRARMPEMPQAATPPAPPNEEAATAPPAGFTPRVVAGKDVEASGEDPYGFFWAVVKAARDAIAKCEITDELRKAVADVDALEDIAKKSIG